MNNLIEFAKVIKTNFGDLIHLTSIQQSLPRDRAPLEARGNYCGKEVRIDYVLPQGYWRCWIDDYGGKMSFDVSEIKEFLERVCNEEVTTDR